MYYERRSDMSLSILCVTKAEPHAREFLKSMETLGEFVVVADGEMATKRLEEWGFAPKTQVHSKAYIESVLDEAVAVCTTPYILRLDDDERCSEAMIQWLRDKKYESSDHWTFPRVHLWPDDTSVLMTEQLFPDMQTRLSVKAKAGNRHAVHAGSPFGPGEYAPVCIEHYKFIVRSYEERLAIAQVYDSFSPGFGTGQMLAYSLPEDAYKDSVHIVARGTGEVPWTPAWDKVLSL
jgi:hypothetical protein